MQDTCTCASPADGVVVVDDCCFDRSYFAHCANLYDMSAKYANVLSLDEIKARLKGPALAAAQ